MKLPQRQPRLPGSKAPRVPGWLKGTQTARLSPELWSSPGQQQQPRAPGASLLRSRRARRQPRVEAAGTAVLSPKLSPSSPVPSPAEKQTLHKSKAPVPGPGSHLRSAASARPAAPPCSLLSARPYQQRLPRALPWRRGQASPALTSPPTLCPPGGSFARSSIHSLMLHRSFPGTFEGDVTTSRCLKVLNPSGGAFQGQGSFPRGALHPLSLLKVKARLSHLPPETPAVPSTPHPTS